MFGVKLRVHIVKYYKEPYRVSILLVFILFFISTNTFSEDSKLKDQNVMLILDLSRSMWGQIDETPKVDIARRVIKKMLDQWDKKTKLGVMVYGHRNNSSCSDIQTLSNLGRVNSRKIMKMLQALRPKGRTPLTASVIMAADILKSKEAAATIILVSDGIENCDMDPCKEATVLKQENSRLRVHVVGFDVEGLKDISKLKCIATNTGGQYYSTNNANELDDILKSVNHIIAKTNNDKPKAKKVESKAKAGKIERNANTKKKGAGPVAVKVESKVIAGSVEPKSKAVRATPKTTINRSQGNLNNKVAINKRIANKLPKYTKLYANKMKCRSLNIRLVTSSDRSKPLPDCAVVVVPSGGELRLNDNFTRNIIVVEKGAKLSVGTKSVGGIIINYGGQAVVAGNIDYILTKSGVTTLKDILVQNVQATGGKTYIKSGGVHKLDGRGYIELTGNARIDGVNYRALIRNPADDSKYIEIHITKKVELLEGSPGIKYRIKSGGDLSINSSVSSSMVVVHKDGKLTLNKGYVTKVHNRGGKILVKGGVFKEKDQKKKAKKKYMYDKSYSFAIVPQQSAKKTNLTWGPILKHITKQTGIKLELKTSKTIPEFEKELEVGWHDFSYMNPFHYTVFHDIANYNAIAKAKDKRIKGIIVVRKDSSVKSLKDLSGSELAFPSPSAFAATILTRAYLKQQKIFIRPAYVLSHDLVYRAIASKKYTAGGGIMRTMKNTDKNVSNMLRVLWTTKNFTPHAIAVHERVPKEVVERVKKSLEELHTTEEGMKLLYAIKLKGFVNAKNSDWDDVRSLKINRLTITEPY